MNIFDSPPNIFDDVSLKKKPDLSGASTVFQTPSGMKTSTPMVNSGPDPYVTAGNFVKDVAVGNDQSAGGIWRNTILGLPQATQETIPKIAVNTLQGINRTVASLGVGTANQVANAPFGKAIGMQSFDESIPTTGNPITKVVFGGEPIQTPQKYISDTQKSLEPYISKTGSFALSPLLVAGSMFLDLSMFGGKPGIKSFTSGEIPEAFFKYMAKEENPAVIESTLKSVGLDDLNSKLLAPKLAETKTVGEVKDVLASHEIPKSINTSNYQNTPPFESKAIFGEPTPSTPVVKPAIPQGITTPVKIEPLTTPSALDSFSLPSSVSNKNTPFNQRAHFFNNLLSSPEFVMEKIGMGNEYRAISDANRNYQLELPKNQQIINNWAKEVPTPESNKKIFQYLDGNKDALPLNPVEMKVAGEIKAWLSNWADRLGLQPEERISNYITHVWADKKGGEIPEEISKLLAHQKLPGSVYDKFLLERLGAKGYIPDTWAALDAYQKIATRKAWMDPVLDTLKTKTRMLDPEAETAKYIERYASGINFRPTDFEKGMDNWIKSVVGLNLGPRPTKAVLSSLRKLTSAARLGMSFTSAAKNLTQGINTFSKLGTKYTTLGYTDLITKGIGELKENGVFLDSFVQDRNIKAIKKVLDKAGSALFSNFTATEAINRGAAYYGGKRQYLGGDARPIDVKRVLGSIPDKLTESDAKKFGVYMAGNTQFLFGGVDTPVFLNSEAMKTAAQFQTYTIKQAEFLYNLGKDKNYAAILRYILASTIIFGTIGRAFGMDPSNMIPSARFGTPPSLDAAFRFYNDLIGTKDQYGKVPSGGARLRDAGNAFLTELVPGGTQINRTFQGLSTVAQGKSTTAAGNFQYKVDQTPGNYIRAALFGKSSLPEAQTYYNKKNAPKAITNDTGTNIFD